MRRAEREIKDSNKIRQIIENCKIVRIGLKDEESVYIVPMSFGYTYEADTLNLYFHSAKEGRKVDLMAANGEIGFEMDCGYELLEASSPCAYSCRYASIIGTGTVYALEEPAEKIKALTLIMEHQTGKKFTFEEKMTEHTAAFQIKVREFTCKSNGH